MILVGKKEPKSPAEGGQADSIGMFEPWHPEPPTGEDKVDKQTLFLGEFDTKSPGHKTARPQVQRPRVRSPTSSIAGWSRAMPPGNGRGKNARVPTTRSNRHCRGASHVSRQAGMPAPANENAGRSIHPPIADSPAMPNPIRILAGHRHEALARLDRPRPGPLESGGGRHRRDVESDHRGRSVGHGTV